jgi:hypothetical protein
MGISLNFEMSTHIRIGRARKMGYTWWGGAMIVQCTIRKVRIRASPANPSRRKGDENCRPAEPLGAREKRVEKTPRAATTQRYASLISAVTRAQHSRTFSERIAAAKRVSANQHSSCIRAPCAFSLGTFL